MRYVNLCPHTIVLMKDIWTPPQWKPDLFALGWREGTHVRVLEVER